MNTISQYSKAKLTRMRIIITSAINKFIYLVFKILVLSDWNHKVPMHVIIISTKLSILLCCFTVCHYLFYIFGNRKTEFLIIIFRNRNKDGLFFFVSHFDGSTLTSLFNRGRIRVLIGVPGKFFVSVRIADLFRLH